MQQDHDATEFFIKAIYHWFCDEEEVANFNLEMAMTSLNVNDMYRKEILNKLN
jgi:hypothetical protein